MPPIPDLRPSRGPQIARLTFRTARPGELDDGRVADLIDEPGQRVVVTRQGETPPGCSRVSIDSLII
uniref:hypothetical protein n=1 Tax=Streptomyces chartreusis TaxID=1969 RepID=UPI003F494384